MNSNIVNIVLFSYFRFRDSSGRYFSQCQMPWEDQTHKQPSFVSFQLPERGYGESICEWSHAKTFRSLPWLISTSIFNFRKQESEYWQPFACGEKERWISLWNIPPASEIHSNFQRRIDFHCQHRGGKSELGNVAGHLWWARSHLGHKFHFQLYFYEKSLKEGSEECCKYSGSPAEFFLKLWRGRWRTQGHERTLWYANVWSFGSQILNRQDIFARESIGWVFDKRVQNSGRKRLSLWKHIFDRSSLWNGRWGKIERDENALRCT